MKRLLLIAVFALVAASCASGTGVSSETTVAPSEAPATTTTSPGPAQANQPDATTPSASEDTTAPADTTTSEAPAEPAGPPPEGPVAPDFTLALGEDGSETFTLSQGSKPVFMIFWAEW
jgi:hypothetical protein